VKDVKDYLQKTEDNMQKMKTWTRRLHRDRDGKRFISGDEDVKDQPAVFLMKFLMVILFNGMVSRFA